MVERAHIGEELLSVFKLLISVNQNTWLQRKEMEIATFFMVATG
jgi:hypothetical protein